MNEWTFESLISVAGYALETVGVVVIIMGSIMATARMLRENRSDSEQSRYVTYRRRLGRSMMLGLEFLVAGDIIRTVIVADTLSEVAALGMIVIIRTILVFTLHLEVEGRWPWQPAASSGRVKPEL